MPTGHISFSLSQNDLNMVKSVEPGGNWRSIPTWIPSRRLEQIRRSGGRTTLYGRLQWDRPSYTITTYFNRPGNGCYIHPEAHRVITPLEAARLQSFPDSFSFFGSRTKLTKQIGNAVPPLLAFALASQLKKQDSSLHTFVDLFAGAGGMSLGFQWAGFECVMGTDFDKDASSTYKLNHPQTPFICGDITDKDTLDSIYSALDRTPRVDIIVGGPPCQGFSHAGKRLVDDPRNSLYKEFVNVVFRYQPKLFVMENVEGILSINSGKTFESIKEDFSSLGYSVSGRKLIAPTFAVPQRRKRVFLIGSKKQDPNFLFPETLLDEDHFQTVRDAIGDLPYETSASLDEEVIPLPPKGPYQLLMQGHITAREFTSIIDGSSATAPRLF